MNLPQLLEARYGKPHLSYSSLKQSLEDIARFDAYMKKEITYKSDALDFGTMYDMLLFERDKAMETYTIVDHEYILERCSAATQSTKAPKATKEYKEIKEAIENDLTANGKVLCNPDDWKTANDMIDRLHTCGITKEYFAGDYQVPIMKNILDIKVKGFIDCWDKDRAMVVDSKSTRSISGFRYDVGKLSYDIQAYLYMQATSAKEFYWVAQEKDYPYLPAVVKCSEETLFKGEMKTRAAIARIKDFLKNNTDPKSDFVTYEV